MCRKTCIDTCSSGNFREAVHLCLTRAHQSATVRRVCVCARLLIHHSLPDPAPPFFLGRCLCSVSVSCARPSATAWHLLVSPALRQLRCAVLCCAEKKCLRMHASAPPHPHTRSNVSGNPCAGPCYIGVWDKGNGQVVTR